MLFTDLSSERVVNALSKVVILNCFRLNRETVSILIGKLGFT